MYTHCATFSGTCAVLGCKTTAQNKQVALAMLKDQDWKVAANAYVCKKHGAISYKRR